MKSRIKKDSWLLTEKIAHRGLHDSEHPENSKSAYALAIEKGYPIEMDLQLTKDNEIVCFHDDSLKRMTGEDSLIWDKTYLEISKLNLADSNEKIMTFKEFLDFVDGRTPVLIEFKSQRTKKVIVDKAIALLDGYRGEFAVQSFDPTIVLELKKKRPDWIRGQLVDRERHKNLSYILDKVLAHCLFNILTKPDFINMNVKFLPLSKRMKGKRNVLTWTIDSEEKLQKGKAFADNVIFEKLRDNQLI